MWNYIGSLFTFGFWFNLMAVPFLPVFDKAILLLVTASFLAGIALEVYLRKASIEKDLRPLWRSATALCLWAGGTGLFLYAMTWQRIPVLSMRFFWVLWAAGFGYWKFLLWRKWKIEIPQARKALAEKAAYEKWLPKPKH